MRLLYTEDLDALEKEIKGLEKFSEDKVSAVSSVAKYLSKLATDTYRRKGLKETIEDNNKNIQIITTAISDVISKDYKSLLESEEEALTKYYKNINATYRDSEPLAVKISMKSRDSSASEINKRMKAISSLETLIKKVGSGHEELMKKSKDLDSDEVIKFIKTYVNEAKPIIKQVKDAYK